MARLALEKDQRGQSKSEKEDRAKTKAAARDDKKERAKAKAAAKAADKYVRDQKALLKEELVKVRSAANEERDNAKRDLAEIQTVRREVRAKLKGQRHKDKEERNRPKRPQQPQGNHDQGTTKDADESQSDQASKRLRLHTKSPQDPKRPEEVRRPQAPPRCAVRVRLWR